MRTYLPTRRSVNTSSGARSHDYTRNVALPQQWRERSSHDSVRRDCVIEYHVEILSNVCELVRSRPANARGIVDEDYVDYWESAIGRVKDNPGQDLFHRVLHISPG